jgi:hypothetical protein
VTSRMNCEIQILAVELDGHDGIVLTFSDGTTGGYVVEELLALTKSIRRPYPSMSTRGSRIGISFAAQGCYRIQGNGTPSRDQNREEGNHQ